MIYENGENEPAPSRLYGDPEQPLDGSETEEEVPVAEADDSDVNSEMESVLFDWH